MRHEIGERHFPRKDKRDRAGKQADQDEYAAEELKHSRKPDQREKLRCNPCRL
jgi:hypothetical protein